MKKILVIYLIMFLAKSSYSQTVYTFNGDGKWSDSANWLNKVIPPSILDSGVQILINPVSNGSCILDTLQFIPKGAAITVSQGKKIILNNSRNLNSGARVINGQVMLPVGSNFLLRDLTINSYLFKCPPKNDGSFKIMLPDTASEAVLTLTNKTGDVIMLKYTTQNDKEYLISSESTALALLTLYPLLLPVGVSEKKTLIEKYKNEPEFNQLVTEINQLNQQGKNLFDTTNGNMIRLVNLLIGKDYNNVRQKNNAILGNSAPINITSTANGAFTIINSATHSYAGQVFKGNTSLGTPFNIAGSYLQDNVILNLVYQYVIGPEAFQKIRTVNLKALGGIPGEYEIKITSGDNTLQSTNLNSIAIQQNITELTCLVLGNLLPDFTSLIKNPCFNTILKQAINATSFTGIYQAVQEDKVLEKYVKPIILEAIQGLGKSTYECATDVIIQQLLGYVELIGKIIPVVKYGVDWATDKNTMVGCQLLDESLKTSSCFTVKTTPLPSNVRICKTISMKGSTVQNAMYYPYLANNIGSKNIILNALNGRFASTSAKTISVNTDAGGEFTIDWITPSTIGNATVKASVQVNGSEITTNNFTTTTTMYNPKPNTSGGGQTGEINQLLPKHITFFLEDNNGQLLTESIPYEKYSVRYEIKGGGSLELKPDPTGVVVDNQWTLGADEGEQSVTAIISSKPCDGLSTPQDLLSISFTATAASAFTDDRDGQVYSYKQIGTQVWMTQNLNYNALGSWCNNCSIYGRLYDGVTALTVAPAGWHLPTGAEWTTLINFIGGITAGGSMKTVTGWSPPNIGATNSNEFNGLPAGQHTPAGFDGLGNYLGWWSSTGTITTINTNSSNITVNPRDPTYGFSVRCVKD